MIHDAIVVGAGPAGSATAALLAERGFRVALLERATFPRPKPCAEYLSPEASRILDRLGLGEALAAEAPARLKGMRIVSPNGTTFTGHFAGAHPFRGYSDHGLALPREVLDNHLAQAALGRGTRLLERANVEGMGPVEHGTRTLRVRIGRRSSTMSARLIVGADGLNSRIARHLGVTRRSRLRRMAFMTHATGVAGMGDVGEMHVGREGYLGLAPVGHGLTNVALVVDLALSKPRGGLEKSFHSLLCRYPAVLRRFAEATFVKPVRAVGPFGRRTTRATADRVLLVGDAADFYDPFTGEGIYAALRGAELAAEQTVSALGLDRLCATDLAPYDSARRREFGGKWIVERIVGWAVATPPALNRIARRLAAEPALGDLLIGVAGNFVPPSQILRPSYVWRLLR